MYYDCRGNTGPVITKVLAIGAMQEGRTGPATTPYSVIPSSDAHQEGVLKIEDVFIRNLEICVGRMY